MIKMYILFFKIFIFFNCITFETSISNIFNEFITVDFYWIVLKLGNIFDSRYILFYI